MILGWYRIWSDGFHEEGYVFQMQGALYQFNFKKPFSNPNYTAVTNPNNTNSWWPLSYISYRTTSFLHIDATTNMNQDNRTGWVSVYVCGY